MIDLQKFCADPNGFIVNTSLTAPWSVGEYTCATNGHIGARVPRRDDVSDNPRAPDLPGLMAKITPSLALSPIPTYLEPPSVRPCSECGGIGFTGPCDKCEGKGACKCGECGHSSECSKCAGSGQIKLTAEQADKLRGTNDAEECEECEGAGKKDNGDQIIRVTDNLYLSAKYLAILRELPNVHLDLLHDGTNKPCYFKFDGGDGVIMPMRVSNSDLPNITDARPTKEAAE